MGTESILEEIGLSKAEATVYLAALETGAKPAALIAKKAGLKRGQTYNVLRSLTEKGIVQEFIKRHVRHYTCSAPSSLMRILETREEELRKKKESLRSIVTHLESRRSAVQSSVKVRSFTGVEGLREVFAEIVTSGEKTLRSIGDPGLLLDSENTKLQSVARRFLESRLQVGMSHRAISPISSHYERFRAREQIDNRSIRLICPMKFEVMIGIFMKSVVIIFPQGQLSAIVIDDETLANSCRLLHDFLWAVLPSEGSVKRSLPPEAGMLLNLVAASPEVLAGLR